MIDASFFQTDGHLSGFRVSGHALFADVGEDIVCAGVSSAVLFTVNAITEILHKEVNLSVLENEIMLKLIEQDEESIHFLEALHLHLMLIFEDYPDSLTVKMMED